MLPELLEFAMLFAFGFSWPFAIMRTYRAKRVDGKSPAFMIIVLIGYLCGIERLLAHPCGAPFGRLPRNKFLA